MTGCRPISLWEEAASLKRNGTGWDDQMEEVVAWKKVFRGRGGVRVALQAQVSHKHPPSPSLFFCVPAWPPLFKPSLAPVREEAVVDALPHHIHSRALKPGRKLLLLCFAKWKL